MTSENNLKRLHSAGQSYWLDNLTKSKIAGGELHHRIATQGLRGITSNPAIFHKAITHSDDYDARIEDLGRHEMQTAAIYEALVVQDIQQACDVLQPVYDESGGDDGYVSLEVSPWLAHDTDGTVEEARRLFKSVSRGNLLIKVPGTPAGIPAIEELLAEGINVNVTLLFSVKRYKDVALAYMRALEFREKEGYPLDGLTSVASFFVSRIDGLVDRLLSHRRLPPERDNRAVPPEALMGKAAIANARLAYRAFQDIESSARWKKLAGSGARIQRLLWASTSVKNPAYNDVKYIEPLIGPHTITTMPDDTAAAFADHGRVEDDSITRHLNEAHRIFDSLEHLDIRFNCITYQLMNEGIQKFIDPYDATLQAIRDKVHEQCGRTGSQALQ